ncbi:MAG: hypothetical protein IJ509_00500 [Bacilli bacterium]|nr:hypothetical protein [Bacilli bacterium]
MTKNTSTNKIIHIYKEYIIAVVLKVKIEYYNEPYITYEEFNLIKSVMDYLSFSNYLPKFRLIESELGQQDFYCAGNTIFPTKFMELNLSRIETFYKKDIEDSDFLKVIWNEQFIYSIIHEFKKIKVELDIHKNNNPNDTYISLDEVLNRLFGSATTFYEKIASELTTRDHINIISEIDKNCFNCAKSDCQKTYLSKEDYSLETGCPNWHNESLVGKTKILKKDKVKFWNLQ